MKQNLHIAMIIDAWFPFWGGGQIHVLNLTKSLKKFHISSKIYYPPHHHLIIRVLWSFFIPIQIFLDNYKRPFSLIHSHGYNSGVAGKLASLWLRKPVVHTVHGSNLLDRNVSGIKFKFEKWLLTQIKYSAQITVSSTFLRHPNVNKYISVIPNGVNITDFNKLQIQPSKNPTIIWVGRINEPLKGYSYLTQAYNQLKLTIPNLQLTIVSGGSHSGISLIKAYKRAHVFVLPSLSEGQPISLLEAWAAKLPVVVTRVGDNSRMVINNYNGLLVAPQNVPQLTNAISSLLKNHKKARLMGLNGYKLVKKYYTWVQVAQQTLSVYTQVLK